MTTISVDRAELIMKKPTLGTPKEKNKPILDSIRVRVGTAQYVIALPVINQTREGIASQKR